jgi:hypothetical protein
MNFERPISSWYAPFRRLYLEITGVQRSNGKAEMGIDLSVRPASMRESIQYDECTIGTVHLRNEPALSDRKMITV